MIKTPLAVREMRKALSVAERVTSKPFRVVIDPDPSVYDDPDFVLTIKIETFDVLTGRRRGCISTHTGRPMGKSGRWACGMKRPPAGLRTTISVEASKVAAFAVDLEEDEPRL